MKRFLAILAVCLPAVLSAEVIDLAGKWSIHHHASDSATAKEITLPGSMLTNDIGNPVTADTKWTGSLYDMSYYYAPQFEKYRQPGNVKFPFFLTPEKEYVGTAEYTKTVTIPSDWKSRSVTLFLERPHIETEVYVNSRYVGKDSTLSVPHRYDISDYIKPGKENLITIKVYNGIENVCVGQDSHSVTDQTQGNWNGIAGKIELQARPKTHIETMALFPDIENKSVGVKVRLANPGKTSKLTLISDGKQREYEVAPDANGVASVNFSLGDNRRVYCGASVGGGWAWDPKSDYHVKGGARGLAWDRHMPASDDDFAADMETVVQKVDAEAEDILKKGGTVLLTAAGKVKYGNDVKQHYLPVFWNTSWFKMRPPHTTGAAIDTAHPVYDDFPTDDWTNLNWWELVNKAQVINLSQFPKEYQSPMQPIDTWHINRKLGMIVEAKVYDGKLFMTTLDIDTNLENRPVARQMRKSILNYLLGDKFNPDMTVDPSLIRNLYENEAEPIKMYSNDDPDELKPTLK